MDVNIKRIFGQQLTRILPPREPFVLRSGYVKHSTSQPQLEPCSVTVSNKVAPSVPQSKPLPCSKTTDNCLNCGFLLDYALPDLMHSVLGQCA